MLIYRPSFILIQKGKKAFLNNKGKGEEDDSAEDNGKDDRKEEDDGAGIHGHHKDGEGNEVSEKNAIHICSL